MKATIYPGFENSVLRKADEAMQQLQAAIQRSESLWAEGGSDNRARAMGSLEAGAFIAMLSLKSIRHFLADDEDNGITLTTIPFTDDLEDAA